MFFFLERAGVRLLDSKDFVTRTSDRVKEAAYAEELRVPPLLRPKGARAPVAPEEVLAQTWFPFNVQICLNGREWAARQLRRRRSDFKRADNCFTWLGNVELAQRLMDEQL